MMKRLVVLIAMVAGGLHVNAPGAFAQAGSGAGKSGAAQSTTGTDESVLQQSAHAKLVCVACHTGLDPKNVPYRGKVEPVLCLRCHADAQFKHTFHPELAASIRGGKEPRVSCKECHGTHDIASPKVAGTKFSAERLAESCGKCHEKAAQAFAASTHGKALTTNVKGAPTCLSCHRQNITAGHGAADSLATKKAQVLVCQTCHVDGPDARERVASTTSLVPDWQHGAHGQKLEHGDAKAANCVSCHGSHGITKKSEPASSVGRDSVVGTCAKCHGKEERTFNHSVHGAARTSTKTDSMTCATCHGEHAKPLPVDPKTGVAQRPAMEQVCAKCHSPVEFSGTYGISSDRFKDFSDSHHGLSPTDGAVTAANCASCHTAHDVRPKSDSLSSVNKSQLDTTCGKCHPRAGERFDIRPVHGKQGVLAAPVRAWVIPVGVTLAAGLTGAFLFYGWKRRKSA